MHTGAGVEGWLSGLPTLTHFLLPIAEVCESVIDNLQYFFFGHKGSFITVEELCDPVSSPVGEALQTYWALLSDWSPSSSGPWAVVFLSGWRRFDDLRARLAARREALLCACGVLVRFDVKFSSLPWALSKLTGQSASDVERAEFRRFLVEGPAWCKPLFVQALVRRFPTETDLASETALAAMRLADKTRFLTTKLSDLGHAEERQALYSKGPGRSFIHHSRRDLIRRSKVVTWRAAALIPPPVLRPRSSKRRFARQGSGHHGAHVRGECLAEPILDNLVGPLCGGHLVLAVIACALGGAHGSDSPPPVVICRAMGGRAPPSAKHPGLGHLCYHAMGTPGNIIPHLPTIGGGIGGCTPIGDPCFLD